MATTKRPRTAPPNGRSPQVVRDTAEAMRHLKTIASYVERVEASLPLEDAALHLVTLRKVVRAIERDVEPPKERLDRLILEAADAVRANRDALKELAPNDVDLAALVLGTPDVPSFEGELAAKIRRNPDAMRVLISAVAVRASTGSKGGRRRGSKGLDANPGTSESWKKLSAKLFDLVK